MTVGAHDEVYWIIVEDAQFHTETGVRPGTEQIYARASLGKPRCVETIDNTTKYDYGGLYFDVSNDTGRGRLLVHDGPGQLHAPLHPPRRLPDDGRRPRG